MSSVVREQVREIGIRVALSATPGRVRRAVLGRAATVMCVGTVVGLGGALATSRFLTDVQLYANSLERPFALQAQPQ